MVGFKSIILLFTLLLFGACVPQTKQTECRSNEAFNASLRTCVPVVNGPSSFINISNFLPSGPLVKYHNDGTQVTFSVVVDNPYAQAYTIQWERIYNGITYSLSPTTPTSYSVAPALFTGQFGTHVISVKVKDSTNQIVDSHNFELVINAAPKPIIQTASVTPALYSLSYNPNQVPLNFSFTVSNNGASMSGAGYRVDWELFRSGATIDTETDNFPTGNPAGTLSSNGFNYPQYFFDPNSIDGMELGSYILRARVTNTAAEVVAEQQWSIAVQHPPLSKVTNRPIYTSGTGPAATAATIAYDGIPYTASTAFNFRPTTGNTGQANYCVNIASGTGSYATDSSFVRVDWYLDGSLLLYSTWTTAVDNQVCLTDGGPAILSGLVFTNILVGHSIVARVVDEGTGYEYTSSDMNPSLGTYPITWPITLRAQNQAPTVAFGTDSVVTYTTTVGNAKSGCGVLSDTNFTVRINLTGDDFYLSPFVEANFDYSIRLYENSVLIQECTKAGYLNADPNLPGPTDQVGTDGYSCVLRVNSYNSINPIDTQGNTYQIQAEIRDNGSPITITDAISSTLTWSFATDSVLEKETAPVIVGGSWNVSATATEGSAINFAAQITDAEMDDHNYTVQYTTDGGTTWVSLTSGQIFRATSTNPLNWNINYTLPEDFLINPAITSCPASSGLRNGLCTVNFRVIISDIVFDASAASTTSGSDSSIITNFNPAPVLTFVAPNTSPLPSTFSAATTNAFVGHPISITNNPTNNSLGFIYDPSVPGAEKTFRFQWYVRNATTYYNPWEKIAGATSWNLVWTPSLLDQANIVTDNPIHLMLCVDDQPATAVPDPVITLSSCTNTSYWEVTVRNNIAIAHDMSTSSTELATSSAVGQNGNETAVWYETPSLFNTVTSSAAYVASIGNDNKIYVKKMLVKSTGEISNIDPTWIVSFDAIDPLVGTTDSVRDLSITGDGDELYIAYLAAKTGAPASLYPQVRRIDLKNTPGKSAPNIHQSKFGFDYNGMGFTNSCVPAGDCTATAASGVTSITFSASGPTISGGFDLETTIGTYPITFGIYDGATQISNNSSTTMAIDLANIINNSTDPRLAGISATAAAGTVTINGAEASDYFDADLHTSERMADQLGKIYIHNGSWYVPFINTTLPGLNNDTVSYYTGATGAKINSAMVTLQEAPGNTGMANMGAVSKFAAYYEGSSPGNEKLWIAVITKVGSQGRIFKVDPTSFTYVVGTENDNVLSGDVLTDVKIAAAPTRVYVGATTLASDIKLQMFDNNVDPFPSLAASAFEIDDPAFEAAGTSTNDYFTPASMASWQIIPYGAEARIVAAIKGPLPDTTYDVYMARLRYVSSAWSISCGDCVQISELGQNVSEYVDIGFAPIRVGSSSLYRLGSDGTNTLPGAEDGIKDVAFITYGRKDAAVAGSCDPTLGVMNVEAESITPITIFTGVTTKDVGLYRPAFVK